MGLTDRLHALAARRPHVLLLPVPGAAGLRLQAERELAERGWVVATSPADADALLVTGAPGDELALVADRVWQQLPGPRVRLQVTRTDDLTLALDGLPARLADRAAHLADAADRGDGPHGGDPESGSDDDTDMSGSDDDMDMSGSDDDMDMSGSDDDMDMDMGGMDMGGMDMSMPGDLAMADRAADRDGLKLDVLHEQLGPALPYWPAGLVLDVALQGDVVVEATARVLAGAAEAADDPWGEHPGSRRLDRLTTLLAVAGWSDAAVRVAQARDEALAGRAPDGLDALLARVARSRTLRLLGRDLPTGAGHDVAGLVQQLCHDEAPAPLVDAERLVDAVTGLDVGSVRLVVAALAPDTDRMAVAPEPVHG